MMTNYERVKEFHEVFGHPVADKADVLSEHRRELRLNLIHEELSELEEAMSDGDVIAVADALGDLLYVVYGAGLEWGVDLDRVVQEIHRSNMTKLDDDGKPIYREDGKVLKSNNFEEPELAKVINVT